MHKQHSIPTQGSGQGIKSMENKTALQKSWTVLVLQFFVT